MTSAIHRVVLGALAALMLFGCDDDKSKSSEVTPDDAGAKPAVDPNLAKAVAAASAGAGYTGTVPQAAQPEEAGPPEDGVFAPGKGDAEAKPGAAPKVTVGSTGAEPRIALGALPEPGKNQKLGVQLALQTGPRQGLPPINFQLALQAQKPEEGEAASKLLPVVANIEAAGVAPTAQRLPEEIEKAFSGIKGSKVLYRVGPRGGGVDYRHELAKKADKGLDNAVRSLGDVLATLTIPYPEEKVGVGAYWMVTTRDRVSGVDVVSYRMVKLTEVNENTATLSIDVRRYAVSKNFDLPELAQHGKLELESFEASGSGSLEVKSGDPHPQSGQLTLSLNARLIPAAQPDQRMALQSQTRAELDRP